MVERCLSLAGSRDLEPCVMLAEGVSCMLADTHWKRGEVALLSPEGSHKRSFRILGEQGSGRSSGALGPSNPGAPGGVEPPLRNFTPPTPEGLEACASAGTFDPCATLSIRTPEVYQKPFTRGPLRHASNPCGPFLWATWVVSFLPRPLRPRHHGFSSWRAFSSSRERR